MKINKTKVDHAGVTLEIGSQLSPIPLRCDYSRYFTITQEFGAVQSELEQNGATSNFRRVPGLFDHVFYMYINEFDERTQNFHRNNGVTVGQQIQVSFLFKTSGTYQK